MAHSIKIGDGQKVVFDDTFNERHIAHFKAERNHRLAETDHFALGDRTISSEMKTYRQQLRDLPDNTVFAKDSDGNVILDDAGKVTGVTWPTKP
tara:strand:+ start:79 stop:360 length:282 start_codon:yes stop_codon:yes gene_type:complete